MKRVLILILLCFILTIALLVRIWGVNHDLPYIYHGDEPIYLKISQNMFKTGDLNPHFFKYPSLFIYVNSAAYIPYYLLGKLQGIFETRQDILLPISLMTGVAKAPMPSTVLLGRMTSVLFGVGAVWMIFFLGKQLTGKVLVGLLASLMLALSTTNVIESRTVTPNIYVVFFATAALLAIILVYQQGKTWHYLIAGVCIGLTASSKYNGGLIILPLFLAHFFRHGKIELKERNLHHALLLAGLGFFATTPFAILDFKLFIRDFVAEGRHYSRGHAGMEGNTLQWYLGYMWQTAGIIYILATLEVLRGFYSRSKEIIILSVFPIIYFLFINSFVVRNDRTFLPLTPFLFVLAASFIAYLLYRAKNLESTILRKLSVLAIICLVAAGIIQSASQTISDTLQLTSENSRKIASLWISNNLPSGSQIGIGSYAPFVEPTQFSVQAFRRIISNEPEWYIEHGFEYLIFAQRLYGRFYLEPERYSTEVSQYDNFFNQFTLIKRFDDVNNEIRIYKVE